MNTDRQKENTLLEEALTNLKLTMRNYALAQKYMEESGEEAEDILEHTEWQNLSSGPAEKRSKSIEYAEFCRKTGAEERLQKYIKLLWVLGGSTAGTCLYDEPSGNQDARSLLFAEKSRNEALLGRDGALALLAQRATNGLSDNIHADVLTYIFRIGRTEPELLMQARAYEKSETANARSLLTASYLMYQPPQKNSVFSKLMANDQKSSQSNRLLQAAEHSVPALLEGRGDEEDIAVLTEYLHNADASTPLPQEAKDAMLQANPAAGNPHGQASGFRGRVAWQMGLYSFLAQRYDVRQRAVVRVCLFLSPAALLKTILTVVPPEYRESQMAALRADAPGGAQTITESMAEFERAAAANARTEKAGMIQFEEPEKTDTLQAEEPKPPRKAETISTEESEHMEETMAIQIEEPALPKKVETIRIEAPEQTPELPKKADTISIEEQETPEDAEKNAKIADAIRKSLGVKLDSDDDVAVSAVKPAADEAEEAVPAVKISSDNADEAEEAVPAAPTREQLIKQVLKGGKKRKVQWLLEPPLPVLHEKQPDQQPVPEELPVALLAAYCNQEVIRVNRTAEEIAKDVKESDLSAFAVDVYDRWYAAGAQTKQKWVLAFAAVFGGSEAADRLMRDIRDWPQRSRGTIACEAVTALSLSADPSALQEVDSISRKSKYRQVKTAAGHAMELAARERGISTEELADRIVPDLGFDEKGQRVFDYGTRRFTVTLTPAMELLIKNGQGTPIKSMPAPGKTDDAEKSAVAYDAFKQMKKQIRVTVSAQRHRLESALSGLRTWDTGAWEALFVQNPIMHQFAISLIWGVYDGEKLTDTFRYLEDGSFTTMDEEEYSLPEGARIGLAHPVEMDEETLAAWRRQIKDYEITQSVLQLDRPTAQISKTEKGTKKLVRFGGKKLNGLSLTGSLLGKGWHRGSVRDGGRFFSFYLENPASGLEVQLRFSGCAVVDGNETVTVYDTVFYPMGSVKHGSYEPDTPKEETLLPLDDVPMRLFSEVIYRINKATVSGTETDENWQKYC